MGLLAVINFCIKGVPQHSILLPGTAARALMWVLCSNNLCKGVVKTCLDYSIVPTHLKVYVDLHLHSLLATFHHGIAWSM